MAVTYFADHNAVRDIARGTCVISQSKKLNDAEKRDFLLGKQIVWEKDSKALNELIKENQLVDLLEVKLKMETGRSFDNWKGEFKEGLSSIGQLQGSSVMQALDTTLQTRA